MGQQTQASILVVEDNQTLNRGICDILTMHNYEAYSANNGQEALSLLEHKKPDLVLCDVMMPQMDGYTLLRHVRSNAQLRTLPFIFLTAYASTEGKRQAQSVGVEDYLDKPLNSEDLIVAVENALRRTRDLFMESQLQMEALRARIIGTLQHEFRTPLTFILGYAEYLAEVSKEQLEAETLQESVQAILEGGRRLTRLIEKFLILADVQSSEELPGGVEWIDGYQILQDAADTMRKMAAEASLEILVAPPQGDAKVQGNVKYLHEALVQLLENAIQYRRPESQYIWLSLNQQPNTLGFVVKDEGTGIAQEILEEIGQPFVYAKREDRILPGAGLGIPLVQQIACLHKGCLGIETERGKGSTFTLCLPKNLPNNEKCG